MTHDLDFSALLAATGLRSPSVVQLRGHDVLPVTAGPAVERALNEHAVALAAGAVLTLDLARSRVRLLPLARGRVT